MFYCSHKLNTGRASGCSPQPIPAKTVEAAVFGAIAERQQMEEKKCISTKQRKLTRQMVEKFVEVVYVYDSKRIEVELTF
jgi:hypothetical protein